MAIMTKVFGALRRKRNDKDEDAPVRVYVRHNGSLYIKGNELARNAAWRKKVKNMREADLTGRNKKGA